LFTKVAVNRSSVTRYLYADREESADDVSSNEQVVAAGGHRPIEYHSSGALEFSKGVFAVCTDGDAAKVQTSHWE